MNLEQAITELSNVPHVRTKMGGDLGPRFRAEVTEKSASDATLRVSHTGLEGRPPVKVALASTAAGIVVRAEAAAMPEASLLAQFLASRCDSAGPVITGKSLCPKRGSLFELSFAVPGAKAADESSKLTKKGA